MSAHITTHPFIACACLVHRLVPHCKTCCKPESSHAATEDELPQSLAGIDPNFTDGKDTAEWLRERWAGAAPESKAEPMPQGPCRVCGQPIFSERASAGPAPKDRLDNK